MVSPAEFESRTAALQKLALILRQERDESFSDRGADGGLEAFISAWAEGAASVGIEPDVVEYVVEHLDGYAGLNRDEREQSVRLVMSTLRDRFGSQSRVATPAPTPPQEAEAREPLIAPSDPVDRLSGIRDVRKRQLGRLGVQTVRDLLYLFPRRYNDYSALKPVGHLRVGDEVSLLVTVKTVRTRQTRPNFYVTTAVLADASGSVRATWFNQRSLQMRLKPGLEIVVSGKVGQFLGKLNLESPEWETISHEHLNTARLVPVYPATEGLGQRWLRRVVRRTLDDCLAGLRETMSADIRQQFGLIDLHAAIRAIHFPEDWDDLDQARRRLAFDEFLLVQLGLLQRRLRARQAVGSPLTVPDEWLQEFEAGLPFTLTGAQRRAIAEIRQDLAASHPMSRLLQGDVGSGKTVVALAAMLMAAEAGKQAALMAPTELLAEQHHRSISRLLRQAEGAPFRAGRLALLLGRLPAGEKAAAQEAIAGGQASLVIGTHALIQEAVSFNDLGLVVVDEQHRFGVQQRAELVAKGRHPHLFAMRATPIPRTLALTRYGDMDVTVLDELPPGRQVIRTVWRRDDSREPVYDYLRAQAREGRQAFIVCPVIEGSESEDSRAAVDEYNRLRTKVFPDLRLGLLHGQLPSEEKDEVMQRFARGEIDILVSTSVVEVGIDVPNATVMLIEQAHRFGLAQLHQFRGRVGRGEHRSFCILMSSEASEIGARRLKAIEQETDGFRLAEIDLELRGPGEFLGTRQSGLPTLTIARLSDLHTADLARRAAELILERDPELTAPPTQALAAELHRFWDRPTLTA